MTLVHQDVQQESGATSVDVDVSIHFVHALADTDSRREMHDRVGLKHQRLECLTVAHVSADIGRLHIAVRRPGARPVNLRHQAVEDDNVVPAHNETIDEM